MIEHLEVPVLKMPPKYICKAVQILHDYGENRNELREHVLSMFENTDEKSVFRGMYIPTMRAIGLTLGFGQDIRCSSNGRLLFEAYSMSNNEGKRVLGKILVEIDENSYAIMTFLRTQLGADQKSVVDFVTSKDISLGQAPLPEKVAKERIRKLMRYLIEGGIARQENSRYILDDNSYQQIKADTKIMQISEFWNVLLSCYNSIKEVKVGFPSIQIN